MATFSNAFVKNVDTAELSVFTSNSDSTIVLSILCANINGSSAADITVQRKGSGGTDKGYLAFTVPVPADSNFDVLSNKYILPSGDRLLVSASTSGDLDVQVSYVVV